MSRTLREMVLADPFTKAYVGTMLQDLQNGENNNALEAGRPAVDVGTVHTAGRALLDQCKQDCEVFQQEAEALLAEATQHAGYGMEQAGSDFWLTRNGHGAGFWDRGLGPVGDKLTELCGYGTQFGPLDGQVEPDGRVYLT